MPLPTLIRARAERVVGVALALSAGYLGFRAAGAIGLLNGLSAACLIVASWLLMEESNEPPNPKIQAVLGPSEYETYLRERRAFVPRARFTLILPAIVAALVGGWQRAGLYSLAAWAATGLVSMAWISFRSRRTKQRALNGVG